MSGRIGQGGIIKDGLVLWLDAANPRSYPPPYNGTTWVNLVGNNSGTLFNSPTYTPLNYGGISFDGSNNYTIVPNNTVFNTTTPTVELFTTVATNNGTIIARGQYGTNWNFGVSVRPSSILARNNFGDAFFNVSNSGLVHVVVVWDGSGNQYYKNGKYLGRTTIYYSPLPGGDITIGAVRSQVPSTNLQEFANSTVYVVRVYNRPLTESEILQNYNATRGRFGL